LAGTQELHRTNAFPHLAAAASEAAAAMKPLPQGGGRLLLPPLQRHWHRRLASYL